MRKTLASLAVFGLLATGLSACTDDGDSAAGANGGGNTAKGGGKGGIGIILPDEKSSERWRVYDPKYIKDALDAAGVPYTMINAEGDPAKWVAEGEKMINSGIKVFMGVNLDSDSAKIVLDKAKAAGIKTIDYDRLTLNGGADYYVSFDNTEIGRQQGNSLVECMKEKTKGVDSPIVAQLNGSPTDNNATLFKNGYDEVLQPHYDDSSYRKGPEQWVPEWSNDGAGVIFKQMLQQQPDIKAVVAANDGLANAVIKELRKRNLNGIVPVTGQDATVEGLQNVLSGDQCMTIYKQIKPEADAATKLAIELYKGQRVTAKTTPPQKDAVSGDYIPFIAVTSEAIVKKDVKRVIEEGTVDAKDVCKGRFVEYCDEAGIKVKADN